VDGLQVEAEQGEEHEDGEDAAGELHIVLWLVVAHLGQSGEKAFGVGFALDEQEEEAAGEREVAEQEAEVPEDLVGDGLDKDKRFNRVVLIEW
jgi:hypothetical protein